MNDEYAEPHTAAVKTTKTPIGLDTHRTASRRRENSYSSAIASNESFGFSSDD